MYYYIYINDYTNVEWIINVNVIWRRTQDMDEFLHMKIYVLYVKIKTVLSKFVHSTKLLKWLVSNKILTSEELFFLSWQLIMN